MTHHIVTPTGERAVVFPYTSHRSMLGTALSLHVTAEER
jgi:hypothetical protein